MAEYRFERLNERNLSDLIILYADSFGIQTNLEFLRKKYNTAHTGHVFTGFIAYDVHDFPAAYYGVFPTRFTFNGRVILCAQSGDTMTHSLHRKKGLFVKLAEHTFELCKSLQMEFVFGFPNTNSLPGFMKMGWLRDHHLATYRTSVRTMPLSKLAKKYKKIFGEIYDWWIDKAVASALSTQSVVPNSAEADNLFVQIHDDAFFEYKKYFRKYILNTGKANWYVRIDGRMFIGDFELSPGADFHYEFRQLKKIAWRCGASEIEFQCSPHHKYTSLFASIGLIPFNGTPACYLPLNTTRNSPMFSFVFSDADTF